MYVCFLYTGVKILKNFTFAGCGVRTISITIKNLTCFEVHSTKKTLTTSMLSDLYTV
jgi:hypothetical protein